MRFQEVVAPEIEVPLFEGINKQPFHDDITTLFRHLYDEENMGVVLHIGKTGTVYTENRLPYFGNMSGTVLTEQLIIKLISLNETLEIGQEIKKKRQSFDLCGHTINFL